MTTREYLATAKVGDRARIIFDCTVTRVLYDELSVRYPSSMEHTNIIHGYTDDRDCEIEVIERAKDGESA